MLIFFVLGLLVYMNARLAGKKGRNPLAWGAITLAAFFVSYILLGSVYIAIIYKGPLTRDALMSYFMDKPLVVTMVLLLGVAGVLIVRYFLERSRPDKDAA